MIPRLLELRREVDKASRKDDRYAEARVRLAYCYFAQRVIAVWHGNATSPDYRRAVRVWELRESLHAFVRLLKGQAVKALAELSALEQDEDEDEEDVVYENVGPDHEVERLGRVVAVEEREGMRAGVEKEGGMDRDHRVRCVICLDPYNAEHKAVQLSACRHLVGSNCMTTWLNSTHSAATTCPHCRTTLCERRARRPVVDAATQSRMYDLNCELDLWLNHYLLIIVEDFCHEFEDVGRNGVGDTMGTFVFDLGAECRANGVRYEVWWDEEEEEMVWAPC